jgi:hypothetical protein
LLTDAGVVERIGQKLHRTAIGTALVRSLPLRPATTKDATREQSKTSEPVPHDAGKIEYLCHEIVVSATDSTTYQRFEKGVAESLEMLSFDVERYGRSGETDLVVEVWQSPGYRRRVAVEVKTDGQGVVSDQDIKFEALEDHRQFHNAEASVIIGPGFSSRVAKWAENKGIVLITAESLAALLKRQHRTPLSPHELSSLFIAGERDRVEERWREAERRQEVLAHVLNIAWQSGNDPIEVQYTAGVLEVRDIWRESKGRLQTPLDEAEIRHALDFLTTPFAAGVAKSVSHVGVIGCLS